MEYYYIWFRGGTPREQMDDLSKNFGFPSVKLQINIGTQHVDKYFG